MNALWGQGLMSLAKVLVVVDDWVNVRNPQEAWWVALNNIDPERDTRFTMGPIDVLDHSSRAFTYGSKMGIDATRKWKEEGSRPGGRTRSSWIRRRSTGLMRCGRIWVLSSNREGQTFGGESLFIRYVNFVKLPHTVF